MELADLSGATVSLRPASAAATTKAAATGTFLAMRGLALPVTSSDSCAPEAAVVRTGRRRHKDPITGIQSINAAERTSHRAGERQDRRMPLLRFAGLRKAAR